MKRRARTEVDLDALQQRVADLEALLVSPGWAVVCAEANTLHGTRPFTEAVEQAARMGTALQIGESVIALVAARMAAGHLVSLPVDLLDEAKRKIADAQQQQAPHGPTLGANVELST
jgi:hypothetical protein